MVAEKRINNKGGRSSSSATSRRSRHSLKEEDEHPPPIVDDENDNEDDEEDEDANEELVDYATTADEFFAHGDSDDEEDSEGNDDIDDAEDDEDVEDVDEEDDEDDIDDDEEEVEEDEYDNDDDEDEDEIRRRKEDQQQLANAANKIVVNGTEEPCTFDLRNLLANSSYPIDSTQLYNTNKNGSKVQTKVSKSIIISQQVSVVNDEYLLQKSIEGCNQLISALWQLPMEKSDVGPMVLLPSYDDSKIPRKLPPPAPKVETKWEKFAKAKGIGQNKDKRSAKVWDEAIGDWQYRHGYKKAGSDTKEYPIMEVKAGDDPYADPWEKQRDAKRKRVDKNMEQQMRNEERAGNISKGTSTRIVKSIAASRKAGREGGKLDIPGGVPVDLKSSGKKGNSDIVPNSQPSRVQQRGKASTTAALLATQVSTASLGRFDKMREGEPERNKAISKSVLKKRKFESTTDKNTIATEAERSMKILKSLANGGVTKEKERKKGKLATGESAFDYDYDDGLGASTFRKKKGRAGAGKAKKMTKKRTK